MNESFCQGCRHYGGKYSGDRWLCGSRVSEIESKVIPGHVIFKPEDFIICSPSRQNAPNYCPYHLEHFVATPDDVCQLRRKDSRLEYNGNSCAIFYRQWLLDGLKKENQK